MKTYLLSTSLIFVFFSLSSINILGVAVAIGWKLKFPSWKLGYVAAGSSFSPGQMLAMGLEKLTTQTNGDPGGGGTNVCV